MHVLANWIAKLVQFLSLIMQTVIVDLFVLQVDLFVQSSVHSSGPFGGPFSDWGGSSEPREPPLATALVLVQSAELQLCMSMVSSSGLYQLHWNISIKHFGRPCSSQ